MTIVMCLIVIALLLCLCGSAVRTWRDIKRMNKAFDHKPCVPSDHDAGYLEQQWLEQRHRAGQP